MRIIYTDHARDRMMEREISTRNILSVITSPAYSIRRGRKVEAIGKVNGRTLKIIYSEYSKVIVVLTVI